MNNWRKYGKTALAAGLAAVLMISGSKGILSFAAQEAAVSVNAGNVGKLKAAQDAEKLIVVVGNGTDRVEVSYYEKKTGVQGDEKGPGVMNESWEEIFKTPGVCGVNGITTEKREGDGKTPAGTYQFTMAFGLKENPGSLLPYHKVQSGDYWVDDSSSQYYNQLVNTNVTKKTWSSAENMSTQAPFYNYALVLNYNSDCVPGMGSAIFLHCTKSEADTGSAGCIRIPEELAKLLVLSADEKTSIVIAGDSSLLEFQ